MFVHPIDPKLLPKRPIRLVLVNPRSPESFWSFRWALREVLSDKRAINPPLGLATLAALTPAHWDIAICDENIEPLPLDPDADIVGIGGMAVQFPRQRELLGYYREKGYHVVAGGSYVSLSPSSYEGLVDTLIIGEAELIWPAFCRDFEQGIAARRYHQAVPVDLRHSPTPRYDLIKFSSYTTASLQFSRGCPYQCEFCDIPVLFGRKPRTKTLEQIHDELDLLRRYGVHNVFFVDDNLIGHRPRALALLEFLTEYQRCHNYPFSFGTEVSVNLATDRELLSRVRAAGFHWVFLGIETPETESLAETGKKQNLRGSLLDAVRAFYQNGIDVFSGFIVGFDHDSVKTFERQYHFIEASGIQVAMLGLLTAVPRTPLYERLRRENRLRAHVQPGDNTGGQTNIVPLGMTYDELTVGYAALYERLTSYRAMAMRIRNKFRFYRKNHHSFRHHANERHAGRTLWRLAIRGILRSGVVCGARFVWSLGHVRPSLWPDACQDWAAGFSIREYARRYVCHPTFRERLSIERHVVQLLRKLQEPTANGIFRIQFERLSRPVRLRMVVGRSCQSADLKSALNLMNRLLRRFRTLTLVLEFKDAPISHHVHIGQWMDRLRHAGDRISIEWDKPLMPGIDSSRFAVATRIAS